MIDTDVKVTRRAGGGYNVDFTGDNRATHKTYPALTKRNRYAQEPMNGKNRVGYNSKDTRMHYVNVRPFWSEPINMLPHNLYAATRIPIADTNTLNVNFLGYASLLMLSTYWGPEAFNKVLLGSGALWFLWATDIVPGSRKFLTPEEMWPVIQK